MGEKTSWENHLVSFLAASYADILWAVTSRTDKPKNLYVGGYMSCSFEKERKQIMKQKVEIT